VVPALREAVASMNAIAVYALSTVLAAMSLWMVTHDGFWKPRR